jgi:gamma-glutamyltranspeptidase / glutathione hydrolase
MSGNISRQLVWRKTPVRSAGGVVSAQNQKSADVGARVLAAGGNAIDAAAATAFANAAVEPWMSGIGGIGFMMVWDARNKRSHVVDFGPLSAAGLDVKDYPLTGRMAEDLFGWPEVVENRNITGYKAIAIPGQPEGIRAAVEKFGTWEWRKLIEPAVGLAQEGLEADWYTTVIVATQAANLAKFPASRGWFLPNGLPPVPDWAGTYPRLKNPALAATLQRLAEAGARDYYDGALAKKLVADLSAGGSAIRENDLKNFKARFHDPLEIRRGDRTILVPGGLTAGPSLRDAFQLLDKQAKSAALDAKAFVAYADALSAAYETRLAGMGDETKDGCTTHLSVIDKHGNMVALTQTLLSLFGSRVVLPETGVLCNNGINWFDPAPGKPNSIGPGKRPLCNMLPTLGLKGGEPWLALGASGGRRILPAVFQLISYMSDYGLSAEDAWHRPRIDVSKPGDVAVDPLIEPEVRAALTKRFNVTERARQPYPLGYACPVGVAIEGGSRVGMTEISQPWAGSAAG